MERQIKFKAHVSSELQSKINMSIIFNYLRDNGSISRAKIARDLKISRPAVSRAVERLVRDGYILETKKMKTRTGKRPMLLEINQDKGYVIGIDLGKEKIKMALSKFNCEVIEKYDGLEINNNRDIVEKILNGLYTFLKNDYQKKEIFDKVKAICIGVPANIDEDSGKIIRPSLYNSWRDLNLKEVLQDDLHIPVYIENDVNLSALGEKYYGIGKDFNDLVFIEISEGIGSGILIDGRLLRGSHGSAGEIGFTVIGTDNLGFKIKNKGFLEKFASVDGLRKKIIKSIKEGEKTVLIDMVKADLEKINPSLICRAAFDNDDLARSGIEEMTDFLALGIINLILILDPETIILGGSICSLPHVEELFLEPIMEKVKSTVPFKDARVELSSLGEDAVVIGASYIAVESLILGEFPYRIE